MMCIVGLIADGTRHLLGKGKSSRKQRHLLQEREPRLMGLALALLATPVTEQGDTALHLWGFRH